MDGEEDEEAGADLWQISFEDIEEMDTEVFLFLSFFALFWLSLDLCGHSTARLDTQRLVSVDWSRPVWCRVQGSTFWLGCGCKEAH